MENEKSNKATDNLMKTGLATLIAAVKSSNDLPSSGSNWAFYSSFPAFQTLMNAEASKILMVMQRCINHQQAKGSVVESVGHREVSDRFESLVDINDQLLERIRSQLDEAAGIKPPGVELCVTSEPRKFGRFTLSGTAAAGTAAQPPAAEAASKRPAAAAVGSNNNRGGAKRPHLGERNITRPQLRFSRPPDNSAEPFRPRLTAKPHARVPLKDSLLIRNDDGVESPSFPHPYQAELEALSTPKSLLEAPKEVKTSLPLDRTPLTIVRTKSALKLLIAELRQHKEIAVDLEHHAFRTYLGLTCLMQISTWDQDFIVDTLELWDRLEKLNEVFADPGILKVFHGASSDILWLQRDFGVYVVNMYDTGIGARYLGHSRTGLGLLLEHYCGVTTDKTFQLADWRQRPLSENMISYARKDTHYLLEIFHKQRARLLDQAKSKALEAVWNESRQLCLSRYVKPEVSDTSYLDLYRNVRKQFNGQQLTALQNLVRWRDEVARAEDESHDFVLPNHMLVMICDTLPREQSGVFACCNPIPVLVRKFIRDIHKLVMEARDSSVEAPSLGVLPVKAPTEATAGDPVASPHDLSHTETREAPSPLTTNEERDLLDALLKAGTPAVRLRSASGSGSGGVVRRSSDLKDPLRKYLLTTVDFAARKAPEEEEPAMLLAQPEEASNGHPIAPKRAAAGEQSSSRVERPTKKKVRTEMKQRDKSAEEEEAEEAEGATGGAGGGGREGGTTEEGDEEPFQPFDYSSAELPKSGDIRRPPDRMLTQDSKDSKPSPKKKKKISKPSKKKLKSV